MPFLSKESMQSIYKQVELSLDFSQLDLDIRTSFNHVFVRHSTWTVKNRLTYDDVKRPFTAYSIGIDEGALAVKKKLPKNLRFAIFSMTTYSFLLFQRRITRASTFCFRLCNIVKYSSVAVEIT